jgi:hypothetical protein
MLRSAVLQKLANVLGVLTAAVIRILVMEAVSTSLMMEAASISEGRPVSTRLHTATFQNTVFFNNNKKYADIEGPLFEYL